MYGIEDKHDSVLIIRMMTFFAFLFAGMFLFDWADSQPKFRAGECYRAADYEYWEDYSICKVRKAGQRKYLVECTQPPNFYTGEVETREQTVQIAKVDRYNVSVDCQQFDRKLEVVK